ncbi:PH domain-containing protein [Sutcliffiella rhizosphaerae]|uniref:YokE-like PH domain-containing protein n=1 Tax=Sutcliffiella rhizosphaerae TaxID=2880967 RepID=A0ABN8AAF6_9BACI|nr:PH domain-containing protein [Sutcliffiella rhizosphaerae]CAG9621131.1 hypothetical protein BACCIP111883_01903 [Sutcliffiella rhizosphaerae]
MSKRIEKLVEAAKEHLDHKESIMYCVMGVYEDKRGWVRKGILIATELRVLFYGSRSLGRFDIESFPYEHINSMEMGKSSLGNYIILYTANNKVQIKWINESNSGETEKLVSYVRQNTTNAAHPNSNSAFQHNSTADELKKFAELRDQNIISEEEYERMKDKLLGGTGDHISWLEKRREEREQQQKERVSQRNKNVKNTGKGCLGCLGILFLLGILMNACGMIPDSNDEGWMPMDDITISINNKPISE